MTDVSGKIVSAWALPKRQRESMSVERQEPAVHLVAPEIAATGVRANGEEVFRDCLDGQPGTGQRVDAEEADWIRRARSGDTAAFDWLMTRYRDRALRLAAHVLRRPTEAEDLVQE